MQTSGSSLLFGGLAIDDRVLRRLPLGRFSNRLHEPNSFATRFFSAGDRLLRLFRAGALAADAMVDLRIDELSDSYRNHQTNDLTVDGRGASSFGTGRHFVPQA
jgi:hypothetical protein